MITFVAFEICGASSRYAASTVAIGALLRYRNCDRHRHRAIYLDSRLWLTDNEQLMNRNDSSSKNATQ